MSKVLLQLVNALVTAMAALLTKEQVKAILDKAFDAVENKIESTKTKWDDRAFLPLIKALRIALDVPDNDEE